MDDYILQMPLSKTQRFRLTSNEPMTPRSFKLLRAYLELQEAIAAEIEAEQCQVAEVIAGLARSFARHWQPAEVQSAVGSAETPTPSRITQPEDDK